MIKLLAGIVIGMGVSAAVACASAASTEHTGLSPDRPLYAECVNK